MSLSTKDGHFIRWYNRQTTIRQTNSDDPLIGEILAHNFAKSAPTNKNNNREAHAQQDRDVTGGSNGFPDSRVMLCFISYGFFH